MVLGGLALLWAFVAWEQRRARRGQDQLLDTALLRDRAAARRAWRRCVGQQLVLMGTFFVIPVYLQVVLGLDAFETGKRLLPLSVAMLVFALLGPRIAARRSPRTVAQVGLVAVSVGAIVMLATLDVKLNDTGFKVALALIGAGAGLLASQLGQRDHVVGRADEDQRGRRAAGHRAEPRLLAGHGDHRRRPARRRWRPASASAIADNPAIPAAARRRSLANAEQGIDIVPVAGRRAARRSTAG